MKKLIALVLGSSLIVTSVFAFTDMNQSHWAYETVIKMKNEGIISGFNDNTFRPDSSLTRDQFITMMVKGLKIETSISPMSFTDSSDRWSEEFIKLAGSTMVDLGDTKFRPDDLALREDVAMSIVKLNKLENSDYSLATLEKFSDASDISEGRKKYVAIAVEKGLMKGNANGTFSPKKSLTRAEGAAVVNNALNAIPKENIVNWDGSYISNVDGLTKVKLTKISENEVNFYIKGKKDLTFGINNNAIITGDTAKHEYEIFDNVGEINFRFDGSDLLIETTGYEDLAVLAGRYKVDDGTVSSIVRVTERNPLEGIYLLGEEVDTSKWGNVESFDELGKLMESISLSLTCEILDMTENEATYAIGGFVDGSMIARMGTLEKIGEKWRDVPMFEEDVPTIELEFNDGNLIINGLNEEDKKLNGIYEKQKDSAEEEFSKVQDDVDRLEISEGVFVH